MPERKHSFFRRCSLILLYFSKQYIFANCIFLQTVFFLTVFFPAVFFQFVLFQTVFFIQLWEYFFFFWWFWRFEHCWEIAGVVLDPIYGIKLASPPEIYQPPNLIQPGQFFNNPNKPKKVIKVSLGNCSFSYHLSESWQTAELNSARWVNIPNGNELQKIWKDKYYQKCDQKNITKKTEEYYQTNITRKMCPEYCQMSIFQIKINFKKDFFLTFIGRIWTGRLDSLFGLHLEVEEELYRHLTKLPSSMGVSLVICLFCINKNRHLTKFLPDLVNRPLVECP